MKPSTARLRGAIGVAALMLTGVALGIVLDRMVLARPADAASMRADHLSIVTSLTDQLGLDEGQAARVREILDRHQQVVDDTWAATHRALLAALDSVTVQVEAELRPGQIAAFHAWIDALHPPGDPRRPNHPEH